MVGRASGRRKNTAGLQVLLKVKGHVDDVNAVAWADDSGQVVLSGSDDCMCQVLCPPHPPSRTTIFGISSSIRSVCINLSGVCCHLAVHSQCTCA